MSLCLSRAEIEELTRTPFKRRQAEFLRSNGIRHYLDNDGWPVVLRSAVEPEGKIVEPQRWKPNKVA